jgi:hypothetical protein
LFDAWYSPDWLRWGAGWHAARAIKKSTPVGRMRLQRERGRVEPANDKLTGAERPVQ